MLRKFTAFAVILVSCFAHSAHAEATGKEAKAYASNIGDQVLSIMNDENGTTNEKLANLENLFVDVVDVDWVGRFVLGRHWRTATDEQKAEYLPAYRDFLIKHYTSRFAEYSGETFTIEDAQNRSGNFMVRMNIQRPRGQQPVIVDYMLRPAGDDFKVFDIVVEGVSLINTQRSEFTSAVERKGLDRLIELLKKKTNALAAETSKEVDAKAQ